MRNLAHCLGIIAILVAGVGSANAQQARPHDPATSHVIPAFTVPAAVSGVAYERFAVIGDMGTGLPDQRTVASALAKRAAEGLDFMLTVGDNFYQDGVTSIDDPQWKTKFEDIYSDAALQVPIFASLGNHDHRGSIEAQINYTQRNPNWRMPAAYYTFTRRLADGTTVQFFAIDSTPIALSLEGSEKQLKWLDSELSKSTARWKIVYGHHPLYSSSPQRGNDQTMIAALEPLFLKHRPDIYLAGHDHHLELHKPIKGMDYVISGGGAGWFKAYPVNWTDQSVYVSTGGGFIICRVSKSELVIEFVRANGRTQFAHTWTK